jgi:uncharacterized damage-inducible protein DinB
MPAPDLSTIPPFYHGYVSQIQADDAASATSKHMQPLIDALSSLGEEEWEYAYAPGKWSLKELVQHMIDTERIFAHRALSIARQDPNPLPGFDENAYADCSAASTRTGASLYEELKAVSTSTKYLIASFNEEQLSAKGTANGKPITVNAIAYILAGHAAHHTRIIRDRYLDKSYKQTAA